MVKTTMRTIVLICAATTTIIPICSAAESSFTPRQGTDVSYGIWFDRDGGADNPWKPYEVLSGPTSGIYDVQIIYHAVDADTATMFATVNGIQQGFYVNGTDFAPAGRSFESSSLNTMQIFWWSQFPQLRAGNIGLSGISATGNLGTIAYGDLTWTKALDDPTAIDSGEFADVWDLTSADLTLSYTLDFQGVSGDSSAWPRLLLEIGLTPDGVATDGDAVGGGWMVALQRYLEPSPDTWSYGDKLDLHAWGYGHDNEWNYDVTIIPVPGALLLTSLGGMVVAWMRHRRNL